MANDDLKSYVAYLSKWRPLRARMLNDFYAEICRSILQEGEDWSVEEFAGVTTHGYFDLRHASGIVVTIYEPRFGRFFRSVSVVVGLPGQPGDVIPMYNPGIIWRFMLKRAFRVWMARNG